MTDPVILRDIRRDGGMMAIALIPGLLLIGAGIGTLVTGVIQQSTDQDDVVVGALVGLVVGAFPAAVIARQLMRGAPDVRLDVRGIVWGNDRTRHLSLDWSDVARVRVWRNPVQLGDTGALVFEPVNGHRPTHRIGAFERLRNLVFRTEYGTKYAIATWSTDCSFAELCELVVAHVPGTALPADGPLR